LRSSIQPDSRQRGTDGPASGGIASMPAAIASSLDRSAIQTFSAQESVISIGICYLHLNWPRLPFWGLAPVGTTFLMAERSTCS
jgi:hypothetical protein